MAALILLASRERKLGLTVALAKWLMDRRQAAETEATAPVYGEAPYQSAGWRQARTVASKGQVLLHPDKETPRDNARYLIHNLDHRYGPPPAHCVRQASARHRAVVRLRRT